MSFTLQDAADNLLDFPSACQMVKIVSSLSAQALSAANQSDILSVTQTNQQLTVDPLRLVCDEPGGLFTCSLVLQCLLVTCSDYVPPTQTRPAADTTWF